MIQCKVVTPLSQLLHLLIDKESSGVDWNICHYREGGGIFSTSEIMERGVVGCYVFTKSSDLTFWFENTIKIFTYKD